MANFPLGTIQARGHRTSLKYRKEEKNCPSRILYPTTNKDDVKTFSGIQKLKEYEPIIIGRSLNSIACLCI